MRNKFIGFIIIVLFVSTRNQKKNDTETTFLLRLAEPEIAASFKLCVVDV